ncbi:MAG: lytic transglycosylase domain-containing protein [Pseudomonadota bacterium]|nr:lytic transglycosylase domain-containing protein [Pseudomonadota bacterium]
MRDRLASSAAFVPALRRLQRGVVHSAATFVRDVGNGLLDISHNTLALVGLAAVGVLALAIGRADLRGQVEGVALDWLTVRHEERELASGNVLVGLSEPDAVARATAADLKNLPRDQARLATWISRRYRVAPEPISALVREAYTIGKRAQLDPTLILAIMAVESSFNPFAQSSVGAQGLMQVLTRVHDDKYVAFGGNHAAFDPISNLRVGVQVLKDCIARAGGVQEGLRYYVGAALLNDDGGYAGRVIAEQNHMQDVAKGRAVPINATNVPPPVITVKELEATLPVIPAEDAKPAEPDKAVALLR